LIVFVVFPDYGPQFQPGKRERGKVKGKTRALNDEGLAFLVFRLTFCV
jgi:hypothetical protein